MVSPMSHLVITNGKTNNKLGTNEHYYIHPVMYGEEGLM